MIGAFDFTRAVVDAWRGPRVRFGGARLHVPGTRRIRLSVVAGNVRMHRLLDRFVRPGATVVDVGANIGFNALHAARLVGARGRVVAVEPTADNLAVLDANVAAAGLANVTVARAAAGSAAGTRNLFVRGDVSAVNSFYRESCYAHVTDVVRVPVLPLDDLVPGVADVVKIDVEGAELDVLDGMARLLGNPELILLVEWHPLLQRLAGFDPDALPRRLLASGWKLHAVSHTRESPLAAPAIERLAARLEQERRPVELLAYRERAL